MTPAPARRAAELARGLIALTALLALLIGAPWVLLTIAGSPLPHSIPSHDEITTLLTRRDDGTLFLAAIRLVTWGAWVTFAVTTMVELQAQLRGRQAPALPGLGSMQRLTARLVAAVLIASGTAAPAVAAAAPVKAAPVTAEPAAASTQHTVPDQPPAPTRNAPGQDTPAGSTRESAHTDDTDGGGKIRFVHHGDTLWEISADEYGQGGRYRVIYDASRGVDQPRGIPPLTDPDEIYPKQRLVIPEQPGNTGAAPPSHRPHQPRPSTNPTGSPPARPAPSSPSAAPTTGTPAPTPSPGTDGRTRTPAAPPTAGQGGAAPPPAPSTTEPGPASPTPTGGQHDDTAPIGAIAGYSALAAAGLLALLGLKRLIQQRRRRPGHRIRMPEQMSDNELAMRAHEDPASAQLLDIAVRSLSARLADDGRPPPELVAARVTADGIELLLSNSPLTEPPQPADPFRALRDHLWRLDRASNALLPADAARDVPAPYPALVTIGDEDDGAHLLLDLETAGAVTLTGAPEHVTEVLVALALEMASSPWADHIVICCVGFAADLPRALGTGRLRHAASVDEALTDMERHAGDVDAALGDAQMDSVRDARAALVADDAWTPQIILSAEPFRPEQTGRLGALVTGPASSLAAVVAASGSEHSLPGRALDATPGQRVHLDDLHTDVTLQRVTRNQYQQLVADFTTADDTAGVADPAWQHVPAEPPPPQPGAQPAGDAAAGPQAAGRADVLLVSPQPGREPDVQLDFDPDDDVGREDDVVHLDPNAPEIRVLGRVEIAGRDTADIEPGKRKLLPELAAYLALNPGRSAEEVSRALGGPRGPWSKSTRASNMSRLRTWFGRDHHGHNYLPAQGEGPPYTLSPTVRCDWDRFQTLAQRGLARPRDTVGRARAADLQAALELVRGQPFAGAGPANYVWAEHTKQEMISAIVDVTHAVAVTLTDTGDPAAARTVIAQGLDIEPGSELLYRDLFRAEHRAGNISGIDEAAERLLVVLHELGVEMEPETAELLEQLRRHRRRSG